jgi:replicative DNA helicase Mcm
MDNESVINTWKEYFLAHWDTKCSEVFRTKKKCLVIPFIGSPNAVANYDLSLSEVLLDESEECLKAAEVAFEQIYGRITDFKIRISSPINSMRVRVRDIRTKHLNKLIAVEGLIRQITDVKPMVTLLRFECPNCGSPINVLQLEPKMKEPDRCGCGRRGKMKLMSKDMIDCQRLKLEESLDVLEGNEQPRELNVFLTNDLTSPELDKKHTPGTKVLVVGVLKDYPIYSKGGQTTERELVLEANYIEAMVEEYEDITITADQENQIRDMAKDPEVFNRLVKSYAPEIQGYDEVKLAILLQMFGGVKKVDKNGKHNRRGDFHILIIGDPSTGKTVMVRYALKIIPKGRYCAGPGSSGRGLTASVNKDEFLGGWTVQAGALVLAHKGMLVVDEIDKMTDEDRELMHEALEQQTVSVDRASIHVTLNSQTALLAAGNPKKSRFSSYSSIAEQINLPDSLISRFDLIFALRDLPNPEKDSDILDKILEVHCGCETVDPPIDNVLLKKYIAFAKQNIHPKLTPEAQERIKEIYLEMRAKNRNTINEKMIAITPRQAEGIIRLSEASAKVRLSNIVTVDDVDRAGSVMIYSLKQIAFNEEAGTFDIDVRESKVTSTTRMKLDIIEQSFKDTDELTYEQLYEKTRARGIEDCEVDAMIEKLKHQGFIYEPRPGTFKRIS